MLRYLGIFFLLSIFLLTLTIIFSSSLQTAMAKGSEITIKNANVDEKDKLVVVSKINIENITNIGMIKVVGAINGEEFVKNIPLDSIDKTTKKLKVNFVMNKDNEFVSAGKPDEFFVCAYHYTNANNNNNDNNPTSLSFNQKDVIKYFDCNEGDIKSTSFPTEANLFKAKSQVYNKTFTYYKTHAKPEVISFAILGNETTMKPLTNNNTNLSLNNSNIKQYNEKVSNTNFDNNSNKPVKVKIIVPMEDKKDAKKIKIVAMLKGQIKSEMIDNVQKEFDKTGKYTISRTFAFDRNTDMGPIQVGDRFHACVIGQDLNPPEGSECEKKLIKDLYKANSLAAR